MNINELYIYETVDGCVGACNDEPPENCFILTTKKLTSSQIREILNDGNMSLPIKIISELKSNYL